MPSIARNSTPCSAMLKKASRNCSPCKAPRWKQAVADTWVLASGNAAKLAEMRALLAPLALQVVAQDEFGVPAAIEDGIAFVDNALIKARHAALQTGLPAIADDSGIAVDARSEERRVGEACRSRLS